MPYQGMLSFRGIEISTNSNSAGEIDAGHEISDEHIGLLDDLHIEEMAEGFDVEHRHHVRIDADEEGERRRNVRPENRTVVLLHSLPKETLRSLKPRILQPVV